MPTMAEIDYVPAEFAKAPIPPEDEAGPVADVLNASGLTAAASRMPPVAGYQRPRPTPQSSWPAIDFTSPEVIDAALAPLLDNTGREAPPAPATAHPPEVDAADIDDLADQLAALLDADNVFLGVLDREP